MSELVKEQVKNEEDLALLKVRGSKNKEEDKEYVKRLANAILQVHGKHGVARLRCVGAGAVNNATKAALIAKGEALRNGVELVSYDKSFVDVSFETNGKVEVKTGIMKEVTLLKNLIKE